MAYFRQAIERGKNLDPKEHFELRKAYFGLGRLLLASGKTKEGEELLAQAKKLQVQMLAENRKKLTPTKEEEREGMGADVPYIPEADPNRHPYLSLSSAKPATATEQSYAKPRGAAHPRSDPQGKEERYLAEVLALRSTTLPPRKPWSRSMEMLLVTIAKPRNGILRFQAYSVI